VIAAIAFTLFSKAHAPILAAREATKAVRPGPPGRHDPAVRAVAPSGGASRRQSDV
jgi:hypothetical protein